MSTAKPLCSIPTRSEQLLVRTSSTKPPFTTMAMGLLISASTVLGGPDIPPRLIPVRTDQTRHHNIEDESGGFTDSSTALVHSQPAASDLLENVMRLGHGVFFEDGVETVFSTILLETIRRGGNPIINALQNFVMAGRADEEVAAEAFRWIGGMDDARTYNARWQLLISALQYPSLALRDGALMGLAAMQDRRSLSYLRRALTKAENKSLRGDIEVLIRQLQ